jgi:hypothetical protein
VRLSVATLNLVLGTVYTGYGVLTIIDLKREWSRRGFSHFGVAWIFMAFTCGPHHLEHGLHVAFAGRAGGPLDLLAVLVGLPAGVVWFLLRVEALSGGRGDRFLAGRPGAVTALPSASAAYLGVYLAGVVWVVRHGGTFDPNLVPNVLLLGLYALIGYYLLRTQLANHPSLGGWSLSGLSLTLVFPTCGLMHATFAVYASTGRYEVGSAGLLIDWLAVPAAIYFVWVVRGLQQGRLSDWNLAGAGMAQETAPEEAVV